MKDEEFSTIKTDYALAYSALAHRIMSARAFLSHSNTSAAQTLLNECAEQIRMVETTMFTVRVIAESNHQDHGPGQPIPNDNLRT